MHLTSLARGGLAAVGHRFLGARTPASVYLYLTEACPGRCLYCGYPTRHPDRGQELTTAQWLDLIDQMLAAGARKIQFTGGEPMLRPDLGALVERARAAGAVVGVSTSGHGVPGRTGELRGAEVVMVSLDGPPDVHDALRGRGAHERAMAALDALDAAGIRAWTTTVVNHQTVETLDWLIDLAEKRRSAANFVLGLAEDPPGEKPTVFVGVVPGGSFALDETHARTAFRRLAAEKRRGRPIGSSTAYLEYVAEWPDYAHPKLATPHRGVPCLAGRLFAHVDHRGRVFPCGSLFWEIEGADAITLGFREAFGRASARPCAACLYACNIEQNLMFSLDLGTIFGWMRQVMPRGGPGRPGSTR